MLQRRTLPAAIAVGAVGLLLITQISSVAADDTAKVIEWETMVGVPAGLTGAQSQASLRGISGGGLPWRLTSGRGELRVDGELRIEVDGLALAAGPNAGRNPSATFRALVSCVRGDGTVQNIVTGAFAATTGAASAGGGDSRIETRVTLPTPCIAPIVFVTNSAGTAWFAATGR